MFIRFCRLILLFLTTYADLSHGQLLTYQLTPDAGKTSYLQISASVETLQLECGGQDLLVWNKHTLALKRYIVIPPSSLPQSCLITYDEYPTNEASDSIVQLDPELADLRSLVLFSQIDNYLFTGNTKKNPLDSRLLESMQQYSVMTDEGLQRPALARLAMLTRNNYQFSQSNAYARQLEQLTTNEPNSELFTSIIKAQNYFDLQLYPRAIEELDGILEQQYTTFLSPQLQLVMLSLEGFTRILMGELQSNSQSSDAGKHLLEQALVRAKQLHLSELLSDIYNGLATYYRIQGDLLESASMLELALDNLEKLEPDSHFEQFSAITNNLALIYRWQGNLAKSQQYLRRSIYFDKQLDNPVSVALSYANLAKSYLLSGDLAKAKRFYQLSLVFSQAADDKLNTGLTLMELGRLALSQDNVVEAFQLLNQSHPIIELFAVNKLNYLYCYLALAYAKSGQVDKAHTALEKLENSENGMSGKERTELLLLKTSVLQELGKTNRAEKLLNELDDNQLGSVSDRISLKHLQIKLEIEHFKKANSEQQKDNALNNMQLYFEQMVGDIVATGDRFNINEMGLYWMSQSSQLLASYTDFLLHLPQTSMQQIAWEVSERMSGLFTRKKRAFYQHQFTPQNTDNVSHAIKGQLQQARVELLSIAESKRLNKQQEVDHLQERLLLQSQQSALHIDLIDSQLAAKTIAETMADLPKNTLLLKYLFIDHQYFRFEVSNKAWHLSKLDPSLFTQLQSIDPNSINPLNNTTLTNLYDTLLPVDTLKDSTITRIIIVAQGQLHQLPFTMLKNQVTNKYLAEDYELVRAFSASSYLEAQDSQNPSDISGISIFSDPEYDSRATKSNDVDRWHEQFPRLPWTAHAAEKIQQLFSQLPVSHFSGKAATNSNFLSPAMQNAQLIHIATHAYYDEHNPQNVGIVTSRDGANNLDQNGFLSIYDILEQPFYADLVVISACETQMGEDFQQEGVRGLALSMLMQGAGAVIGTVWKIPDKATAIFMSHFYQALHDNGGNVPASLMNARKNMLQSGRYKHPKYWAGFVLTVANSQYEQIQLH